DAEEAPAQLAERLRRDGLLTTFHVKQLLSGRHRGFHVGPYRLLAVLGKGGMGKVFLAEHTKMKRKVALKVLGQELSRDPGMLERFRREARASAALDHPNIVKVLDARAEGGVNYLAMEYVEGQTLEAKLKASGPMSPTEAVGYVAQAARGLQH